MSKFRCAGCKNYFAVGTEFKNNGVQRFCSEACLRAGASKPQRQTQTFNKAKPKRDDIPAATRDRVLARDGFRCRICFTQRGLHVHHINYKSQGGSNEEHNLITLCVRCHVPVVHANKRFWQPRLRAYIWRYYVESRKDRISESYMKDVLDAA